MNVNITTPFLYVTHPLADILMILLPIGLGFYLAARFKIGWRLWGIGAVTFVLSQVGHIPFNAGITWLFAHGILPAPAPSIKFYFNAVFLGLSAGVWEECARWAAYRWWAKDARSWGKGLMLGAGHGGIEAILLGALALYGYIQMVALSGSDLAKLVPANQLELARQQVAAYWSMSLIGSLLPFIERVFAITLHLFCSLLVLQVFTRKQIRWLFAAIFWHALADAGAVYLMRITTPYVTEGAIGIIALLSLAGIFWLRRPEPEDSPPSPPAPLEMTPVSITPPQESDKNIDQTRFHAE